MMFEHLDRPVFHSVEDYGRLFTDGEFWRPYVTEAGARHGLYGSSIRTGLPGTNPVFIVDDQYIVKFFPDLFAGDVSFPIERDLYSLMTSAGGIPAPTLLAHGELFGTDGGWPWPYIIVSLLPGQSIGEVQIDRADMEAIVNWLAPVLRRIHLLPVEYTATLKPEWDQFEQFLAQQQVNLIEQHAAWRSLPAHLAAQLPAFAQETVRLPTNQAPLLIHADLNQDHVLVTERDGHWLPTGIIDFGDARVGDLAYELVALHLGLFEADKHLLQLFLDAYGVPAQERPALLQRAMHMTLLHEFNVVGPLFERWPAVRALPSLHALGEALWNPATPELM
jgi:Ser/Thr protein kinase RdoA (MazF antagonist)